MILFLLVVAVFGVICYGTLRVVIGLTIGILEGVGDFLGGAFQFLCDTFRIPIPERWRSYTGIALVVIATAAIGALLGGMFWKEYLVGNDTVFTHIFSMGTFQLFAASLALLCFVCPVLVPDFTFWLIKALLVLFGIACILGVVFFLVSFLLGLVCGVF